MNAGSNRELWDPARQAMSAEELAAVQRTALEKMWRRIWEQPIPFYKKKFEAAGLNAEEMPPLDEIPRTIKDELRADDAANPPWGTWRGVALEQATSVTASAGTTGKPMMYLRTFKDADKMWSAITRYWWRMGLRPYGRMTHSWPGGVYSGAGGHVNGLRPLPAMEIPVGPPISVDVAAEHLMIWQALKPTAYMTTGSQLHIYEEAAKKIGIDLGELFRGASMAIIEASCQFEGPRKRFEERYNVRIFNTSGSSEIPAGAVSDCRFHTGFHTLPDLAIAQVCDPVTGKEVPEGGRGHLVWTSLDTDAFWLRYDVEDIVERVPGSCPCGEIGLRYRLLGRKSDIFQAGDRMLFPLDVQLALDPHGAPEFVMIKSDKQDGVMRLRIECEGSPNSLVQILEKELGVKVEIEPVAVGSLPRSAFKPKRT
ncbi:phenylacetate--CoA ligase family protein [Aromatoleum petrolei]|uniref:Phenylacetate--CoA ligase family protein n=1 Tax=Aromatoleum petrolei TaxID=76116 RepID=A0ABX1MRJ5_9RHOO|nr:hypothetical protein [Aromatoleum petrolei]NMF88614.1 hypothetical protein [Aromatoleum petrolei]QTQ34677.1 Putative phenylacetate-CoA ligase [Aromatoleum petrolei]